MSQPPSDASADPELSTMAEKEAWLRARGVEIESPAERRAAAAAAAANAHPLDHVEGVTRRVKYVRISHDDSRPFGDAAEVTAWIFSANSLRDRSAAESDSPRTRRLAESGSSATGVDRDGFATALSRACTSSAASLSARSSGDSPFRSVDDESSDRPSGVNPPESIPPAAWPLRRFARGPPPLSFPSVSALMASTASA